MTEEQIRQIIREEMSGMLGYTFSKHIRILDERNIQLGKSVGTKIGTETTQKIGFFNKTPVDQPATISDPSGAGDAGVDTPARTAINAIIDLLQELGLMA